MSKKIPQSQSTSKVRRKVAPVKSESADNLLIVWSFKNIDRDGYFAFDLSRGDLDAKFIFDKIINYSTMTWREILRQTHDEGKSKNHTIVLDSLSKKARERIEKLELADKVDNIYSLALDNTKRLIGIRNGAEFQVIWYDANHDFCSSSKKHT